MNMKSFFYALPVLCLVACNAPNPDEAATTTSESPYLAKEVVGLHALSTDVIYEETCNYIGEEVIQNTFAIKKGTELMVHDHGNGCEYHWGKNHVSLTMTNDRPFASIFKAEYVFDRMPESLAKTAEAHGHEAHATAEHHEAEPKKEVTHAAHETMATDTTAKIEAVAEPMHEAKKYGETVAGIGDKAVWDAATHTLHVLNDNHILHVAVGTTDGNDKTKISQAVALAKVAIGRISHHLPD
jgi:hypothetical protein